MSEGNDENRIHMQNLSPGDVALLKDLAEAASEKACGRVLTAIGLDPDDPIASQAFFGVLRDLARRMNDEDFIADRQWVRRTRTLMQGAVGKAIISAVGLAVVGAGHAIWSGIKAMMPHGPP